MYIIFASPLFCTGYQRQEFIALSDANDNYMYPGKQAATGQRRRKSQSRDYHDVTPESQNKH